LPVTLAALILVHLVMIHQQGLSDPTEPAWPASDPPKEVVTSDSQREDVGEH
jgi:quinol-cytochrome oxidoreductase complex cytochrome b subunit